MFDTQGKTSPLVLNIYTTFSDNTIEEKKRKLNNPIVLKIESFNENLANFGSRSD